ncbi:MAG TPA: adenylosuccinate synthetase [Marinobacter sp.]|uniref:adenylosuccinate synthetase n=1 Tax=Marinobacter sp. TaxID=50741 RepID=UPI002D80986B|nr:adenylosuccinate synthetase [Marinobacter sp.]HET8802918.1 adenylosuccinate synthetase [Marinobacter sp.]
MRQIVILTGRLYTGKSGLAKLLEREFAYEIFKVSNYLKSLANQRGLKNDRESLQNLGFDLDNDTNGEWLSREVQRHICAEETLRPLVIDSVVNKRQLEHFRYLDGVEVVHVHLYAGRVELEGRRNFRDPENNTGDYFDLDNIKCEQDILYFKHDADVRINTSRTDELDTLVRVAGRLGLYSSPDIRCVDVLIGGQYGSEGKGHVAAYLAKDYDVLVRVGGPNAGHTVSSSSGLYTYHHLPSGSKDTNARLLLGPGMTIHVKTLLKEIRDCNIGPDRLFIDPQAMIIDDADKESEKNLVTSIASTGQGSGAAQARRITGRHASGLKLAKDIDDLRPYVGSGPPYRGATLNQLEMAYFQRKLILLEGTQGSGLSIFHGAYPYVTSRDTNVGGCLAEAGISPNRIRRTLMVVRPTPIRVGNPDGAEGYTSGPLKHEVTFEEVAKSAGLEPAEVKGYERTSTTKRARRVSWFEWDQFRRACALNAPTDIVLTFADYIDNKNRNARRFEQLSQDTIKFVEELERIAQAPVSLINTRFVRPEDGGIDLRTVIDRRNWNSFSKLEDRK